MQSWIEFEEFEFGIPSRHVMPITLNLKNVLDLAKDGIKNVLEGKEPEEAYPSLKDPLTRALAEKIAEKMFNELIHRLSADNISLEEKAKEKLKKVLLVLATAAIDYSEKVVYIETTFTDYEGG